VRVEELDFDEAEAHGLDGTGRSGFIAVRVTTEGRTFVGYETTTPLTRQVLRHESGDVITQAALALGVSVDEFVITSAASAAQSWLDDPNE
jgi:hypothetical protein